MPGFFTDGELASDPGSIFDYDVTAGEAFGSGFGRQFDTNPLALVARQARYLNDDLQNIAGGSVDWVDAEKAAGEVQSRGLDLKIPKGGIARHELDMLQYLKQREIEQNTTSARTRGVGPTAAGFAGGLAASLTDPVNVASGFIPIVNQVRYAQWLARAGEGVFARAAVRAGAGAIEGAVGAAILEPIVYAGATSEQLDYGLMDSFLNVTLGGVLGGGLHVIGGAVYDRAGRGAGAPDVEAALRDAAANMPEATQREMFQSAVAAIERGEPVDVTPVVRAYHGSPHVFDKFDVSKIGAGEGAQAFGYGLYFAEERSVAEQYRQKLTDEGSSGPGAVYEVNIKAARDQFIDWDKPLSEQPQAVQDAIRSLAKDYADVYGVKYGAVNNAIRELRRLIDSGSLSGAGAINKLAEIAGGDKRSVSVDLLAAGVRGIQYLDQKSRGSGDGTRNFVIFDDKDVDVLSRNGDVVVRSAPPRNLADLINQSRADRTQEAFNRQFVDKADETLAAEKARPNDKIESVKQDEAEFRDMVEEYRSQGRVTAEDDASLKQADELAAWAERRAKAFEAAAGCIEAA